MTTSSTTEVAAKAGAAPECAVVHAGEAYRGKQGLAYFAGVSAQSVGARGLCMHVLTIPPGGRASAHYHASHESAVYMLGGEAEMWYGDRLQHRVAGRAGDIFYIPAGVPHIPVNTSQTEPATAVLARTDPNEQESVVLTPELDALFEARKA